MSRPWPGEVEGRASSPRPRGPLSSACPCPSLKGPVRRPLGPALGWLWGTAVLPGCFLTPGLILRGFLPQLERQGALLVEFEAPLVTGPELPAPKQNVVLGEDVIQFSPPTEHSLQPGDKVLAPWEPDRQQRYGPATVLGLEARGPRRGKGRCSDLPARRRSQAGDEAGGESKGCLYCQGVLGALKTPYPLTCSLILEVATDTQIISFLLNIFHQGKRA